MSGSNNDQRPAARATDDALAVVEVLPAALVPSDAANAVVLRGDAARDVRDAMGSAVLKGMHLGRRAAEKTYRLVPSEKTAQGLSDGTLRWATAKNGDASVLIKDKATGRIAGQGKLQAVRPSPAKLLGPAAWEAMAMATQQHYLVEINGKLEGIVKGVDEVLARMDDDKRGTLHDVHTAADFLRTRLSEGGLPSAARRIEFRTEVRDVDRVWHQLRERMDRHLEGYLRGDVSAKAVEESWAMLLFATQVLGTTSALLTELPYDSVEDLEEATTEERARVLAAIGAIRSLAGKLHSSHLDWSAKSFEYESRRTRNPAKQAVRAVRRTQAVKPAQAPINYATAWLASQLAASPRLPAALLVSVRGDGTVTVTTEDTTTANSGFTNA
jgi:hypothetical protein